MGLWGTVNAASQIRTCSLWLPRDRNRAWHADEPGMARLGKERDMKLTVIGGTGLMGSQVVQKLTTAGHQAVPAALSTGLDLITGKGLDQALEGAEVVVNVANSPANWRSASGGMA